MDKVITVSREFGSGGRELGVRLAEHFGKKGCFSFYFLETESVRFLSVVYVWLAAE